MYLNENIFIYNKWVIEALDQEEIIVVVKEIVLEEIEIGGRGFIIEKIEIQDIGKNNIKKWG